MNIFKYLFNYHMEMNIMNVKMEKMISKDLGIGINQIRESSWDDLERFPGKRRGKAFRPKNIFIVGGNINLAENREMGKTAVELRNIYRKVAYRVKCLLRNKKNV